MDTNCAKRIKTEISLHHTAGRYQQVFSDYHICVCGDGTVHQMNELDARVSHTWGRNRESIGIAACCAYGAWVTAKGEVHWGEYPPTDAQIDKLAYLSAKIAIEVGIPFENVKTHGEWAEIDGYGLNSGDPETRWDLLGYEDEIRERARGYARAWGCQWW